jgi:hypothetical protein
MRRFCVSPPTLAGFWLRAMSELQFVAERESPGALLIPPSRLTGAVIDGILMVWLTWTPEAQSGPVVTVTAPHGLQCVIA